MMKYVLLAVMALAIAAPSISYADAAKSAKPVKQEVKKEAKKEVKQKRHKAKKAKTAAGHKKNAPFVYNR